MADRPPLRFTKADWRRRWLVTGTWNRLHRISRIDYDDDERLGGHGIAVCGVKGRFTMPGILSRMGRPRCAHCCKALGIPTGDGAPANTLTGKAANA